MLNWIAATRSAPYPWSIRGTWTLVSCRGCIVGPGPLSMCHKMRFAHKVAILRGFPNQSRPTKIYRRRPTLIPTRHIQMLVIPKVHKPLESKTQTYHVRVGAGRVGAGRRGGAGQGRVGRQRVGSPRRQPTLAHPRNRRQLSCTAPQKHEQANSYLNRKKNKTSR